MTQTPTNSPQLHWHSAQQGGISDKLGGHNRKVAAQFASLIKEGKRAEVMQELRHWAPPDLLDLFVHLPLKRARRLLQWLDQRQTRVIAELNPAFRSALLQDETVHRLIEVLNGFESDEAADTLDDFPEEVVQQVLPGLKHRAAIEARRHFAEESAASIMSRKFVAVPPFWTVEQVIDELRAHAEAIEKLYAINVVDEHHRPIGYLRLRDLLLSPKDKPVGEIMHKDFVAVGPHTDQEVVAKLADRYELSVVPVVDADGRLIGRITPKQLHQVLREEAEEDRNLMSGLPADTRPDESLRRIVRGRSPWLLVGLIGACLSAMVVGAFEEQLSQAAILASFIPIVMSTAGNAGIQASTVAVQGLSTGTLTFADLGWRLGKELLGALANGLLAALVLFGLVLLVAEFIVFAKPLVLALTAAGSLTAVVVLAVAVGASIPLLLERVGIDPAMATGVFITTGNDVLSVAVFFLMMSLFYL